MNRTAVQVIADVADCDLYRIIRSIDAMVEMTPALEERVKLRGIAVTLRSARPDLRSLMHPTDRESTHVGN